MPSIFSANRLLGRSVQFKNAFSVVSAFHRKGQSFLRYCFSINKVSISWQAFSYGTSWQGMSG